jgi:phosphoglycerol geranylgeranyltransferase
VNSLYTKILKKIAKGKPLLAVLIDPDKFNKKLIISANKSSVSYFFVGGSSITNGNFESTVAWIKKHSSIPVLIFPGDMEQISAKADAILFLSLISGRNPEYLIDLQVRSAPLIRSKKLEAISTGYLLIDGGKISATQKISKTKPISATDLNLAKATAMAGDMMGMKLIYLEAGSGADKNVPVKLIKAVKSTIFVPLIVGGGIRSALQAKQVAAAGADIVVVGNALEKNAGLLDELNSVFA